MREFFMCFFILLIGGCTSAGNGGLQQANVGKSQLPIVHSFTDKSGKLLGNMFVEFIEGTKVFTSLSIVSPDQQDTLYSINQTVFSNSLGLDFEAAKDDFYGYRIELKNDNYFVLVYLQNEGASISDPLTIKWDERKKVFGRLTFP